MTDDDTGPTDESDDGRPSDDERGGEPSPDRRLVGGWEGRYFEDFAVGDVYKHPYGRTRDGQRLVHER